MFKKKQDENMDKIRNILDKKMNLTLNDGEIISAYSKNFLIDQNMFFSY